MPLNRFLLPKLVGITGIACFTCFSWGLTGQSTQAQDEAPAAKATKTEVQPTEADSADAESAKAETRKPDAKKSEDAPKPQKSETDPADEAAPDAVKTEPAPVFPDVIYLPTENAPPADETLVPVQDAIKAFVTTFNGRDAKAVADLFTDRAELTDLLGRVTSGQKAIQETFNVLFTEHPGVKIRFEVQSLRFLSDDLVVEDGTSIMTGSTGDADTEHRDRYTVTHIKQDGKWLIASARDWPAPAPTREEELKQLDWLAGDWVDENGDAVVATSYHWSEDKSYLLCDYTIHRKGEKPRKGTQRIGWNAQANKLQSWNFDVAGGFSEAIWTRAGNQWIMKIRGVSADGKSRTGTNILTKLSPDHATFQSRDRTMGADLLPDRAEMPIVRKAPEPSRPAKLAPAQAAPAVEDPAPAADAPTTKTPTN